MKGAWEVGTGVEGKEKYRQENIAKTGKREIKRVEQEAILQIITVDVPRSDDPRGV
jgi:hypothetical protein